MPLMPEIETRDAAEQAVKDAGFPAFFQGFVGLFQSYGLSLFSLSISWTIIPVVLISIILIVWALRIRSGHLEGFALLLGISLVVCALNIIALIAVGVSMPALELLVYLAFGAAIQLVLAYFVLRGWSGRQWLKANA